MQPILVYFLGDAFCDTLSHRLSNTFQIHTLQYIIMFFGHVAVFYYYYYFIYYLLDRRIRFEINRGGRLELEKGFVVLKIATDRPAVYIIRSILYIRYSISLHTVSL